jgi:hypothetical protein
VLVAALNGSFRVLNSRGVLVANLANGSALEFEPQQSGGSSRLTGCLVNKSGRFVLTDEVTNVTAEIAGGNAAREAGNRVEVVGMLDPAATPVSEASQYIRATRITRVSRGCQGRPGAPAAAGAGGAAGGVLGGISGTTIAIVGGVAAAATIGGLAAAEQLPGQGGGAGPVSR